MKLGEISLIKENKLAEILFNNKDEFLAMEVKLGDTQLVKEKLNLTSEIRGLLLDVENIRVKYDQLGMNYMLVKEMKRSVLTSEICDLYERGIIELVYKPNSNGVIDFIPYTDSKGKDKIVINITKYVTNVDETVKDSERVRYFDINPKHLHCLLLVGASILVSNQCENFKYYAAAREALIRFYIEMMLMGLNRISSIATSTETTDYFKYAVSSYLAMKYYHMSEDDASSLSLKISASKPLEKIAGFKTKYTEDIMKGLNIESFLTEVLQKEFVQLARIDLTTLVKGYTMTLGSEWVAMMEYLPYVTGLAMAYFDDFSIMTTKTMKMTDQLKAARTTSTVLLQFIEKRIGLFKI